MLRCFVFFSVALHVIQVTNKTFFSIRTSGLFHMAYTSSSHTFKSKSSHHQSPLLHPPPIHPPLCAPVCPVPTTLARGSFRETLILGAHRYQLSRNSPRRTSGWSQTKVIAVLMSTQVVLSDEHKLSPLLNGNKTFSHKIRHFYGQCAQSAVSMSKGERRAAGSCLGKALPSV